MSPEQEKTFTAAVESAVLGAAQQHGTMATNFALVIQTVTPDGKPDLWLIAPDGCPPWQALGMLEYGAELQRADARTVED